MILAEPIFPDWNENDQTSPNYIKNRTHWAETTLTPVSFSCQFDGEMWVPVGSPDVFRLIIGQEYTVEYNDTEYTFTASEIGETGIVGIGNMSLADPTYTPSPYDFPFIFVYASDGDFEANNFSTVASLQGETVSFSILSETITYHPISADYLPADVVDAVVKKHTHTNKTTLDKFGEVTPFVGGFPIATLSNKPAVELGLRLYGGGSFADYLYSGCITRLPDTQSMTVTVLGFANSSGYSCPEYILEFTTGATAPTLTLPASVEWVDELTIEPNRHYQISIVNDVALWCAVDVEAETNE